MISTSQARGAMGKELVCLVGESAREAVLTIPAYTRRDSGRRQAEQRMPSDRLTTAIRVRLSPSLR